MAAIDLTAVGAAPPAHRRDVLGHPRGLGYLVFAEAWERFSFYGMQALLVLYLGSRLLLPGHVEHVAGFALFRSVVFSVTGPLSPAAPASVIFGIYGGLVYVTPLAGGFIADRWLGRTLSVAGGATLMALGHFLMAFEATFLAAITCLIVGVGFFKGNLSCQVGELYPPDDLRRAQAFQIFFLGINFGVLFAPLVCGTLGETVGWHWGFGAAGVGMLAGLAVYLSGRRWLPPDARLSRDAAATPSAKRPLSREDWIRLMLLVVLVPILAIATIGNFQFFNAYLVWAKATYDLTLFARPMPVTWLISLASVASMGLIAGSVAFWRWWGARWREPTEIAKIAMGSVLLAAAPLALSLAASQAVGGHRVSLLWAVAFELINDLGYANLVPVTYALFAVASPPQLRGVMISVCLLQFFVANVLVGGVGTLLEPLGGVRFWLLHAALAGGASFVLFAIWRFFGHTLHPIPDTPEIAADGA